MNRLSCMSRVRGVKGFTLVELLVVIAIIALLAAIVVPSIGGALRRARTAATLSNLRQIGNAFVQYDLTHYHWPRSVNSISSPSEFWSRDALYHLVYGQAADSWDRLAGTIFTTPNAPRVGRTIAPGVTVANPSNQGFGMNNHLPPNDNPWSSILHPNLSSIQRPSACMVLMDCNAPHIIGAEHFRNQFTGLVAMRHDDQNTVLFADGHVEGVPHDRIPLPFHQSPDGTLFWRGHE